MLDGHNGSDITCFVLEHGLIRGSVRVYGPSQRP
jgi:hypothetical protein